MWLTLNNKFLSWEALQKRNRASPSIFLLCTCNEENTSHFFLHCNFSQKICIEVGEFLGIKNLWKGESIDTCLNVWFTREDLKASAQFHLFLRGEYG
jgi:hypothetical protein